MAATPTSTAPCERTNWYENDGEPVQLPGEQVRSWPIAATPVSAGPEVLAGAGGGSGSSRKVLIGA